jgi:hypothetical protein
MEPNAHPKAQDHVVRIVCAKRRYDLCAPSEEEEIKWTAAIRALIKRERARQTGGVAASSEGTGAGPGLAPPQSQSQSPAVPTITQVPPTPASIPSPVSPATLDSPSSASGRRTNAR